jgi:hypothetical protein
LQPFGLLFIAEPAKGWGEGDGLAHAIQEAGFDLLGAFYRRGDFLYVRGVKIEWGSTMVWPGLESGIPLPYTKRSTGPRRACGFSRTLTDGVPKVPKGCSEGFCHFWHLVTLGF